MAFKTYATLGVSTSIADADLLAVFHGSGPLTSITAALMRTGWLDGYYGQLAHTNTFTATQTVSASVAAPVAATDYIALKPSDYAAGKPGLSITKALTAGVWTISVTDGSTAGELDLNVSLLKVPAQTMTGLLTGVACTTGSAGFTLPPGTAPTTPNNGDMWVTASGLFFHAAGVTTQAGISETFFHVRNQQPNGTGNAETYSAGWQTRTLNTSVVNTVPGASLAANQLTLPAGTYEVTALHAPFVPTANQVYIKHRLRNITDAATLLVGVSDYTEGLSPEALSSPMIGQFTIAATKTVELQLWLGGTGPGLFGQAPVTSGEVETFTDLYLRKVA